MRIYKEYNQMIADNLAKGKRKCRCGHTVILPIFKNCDYVICNWCGGRMYYDVVLQKEHDKQCEREEFRMAIRNKIKEQSKKKRRKYEKRKGINYGRPKGSFKNFERTS